MTNDQGDRFSLVIGHLEIGHFLPAGLAPAREVRAFAWQSPSLTRRASEGLINQPNGRARACYTNPTRKRGNVRLAVSSLARRDSVLWTKKPQRPAGPGVGGVRRVA